MSEYRVHDKKPEYLDWLSLGGKVLGRVEKYFSHVHGLLHPVAHIFVFDSRKRLILQFRSHTLTFYPKHWDTSVGGHVHAGEKLLDGARRELKEELWLHVPLHYLGWADFDDRERELHHRERVHYFYSTLPAHVKTIPNEEFDDIARISFEDMPVFLKKHKFTPSFLVGWKKYSKKMQKIIGKSRRD